MDAEAGRSSDNRSSTARGDLIDLRYYFLSCKFQEVVGDFLLLSALCFCFHGSFVRGRLGGGDCANSRNGHSYSLESIAG